jgi:DHA3 family tetracycline resistance protein-like MFS transporter
MRKPTVVFYVYSLASNVLFWTVFSVNMVYQAQVARLSPLQLVLVGTTLELSVLLFEIPTGVVADVFSRKLSVIIGTFLIGLGFVIESQFPSFLPILLAQVIWGIGFTFTSGAFTAWISDEVGVESVQPLLMRGAQMEEIGVIAATIAGVSIAAIRINLPILLAGLGFGLLGLYLTFFMPETGFHPIEVKERRTWSSMQRTVRDGFHLLKTSRLLVYLVVISFFLGLYSEGFDRLWTPFFLQNLQFPAYLGIQPVAWFGAMTIVGSLITLAATEWIRRRLEKSGSSLLFRVLFSTTALLVVGLFLFSISRQIPTAVVLWLAIYVLRRAGTPALTIWYNDRLDSSLRATMLSFVSQVDAFGQIIGGPPIGYIGNIYGIPAALLVSAATLVPALGVFIPLLNSKNLKELEEKRG